MICNFKHNVVWIMCINTSHNKWWLSRKEWMTTMKKKILGKEVKSILQTREFLHFNSRFVGGPFEYDFRLFFHRIEIERISDCDGWKSVIFDANGPGAMHGKKKPMWIKTKTFVWIEKSCQLRKIRATLTVSRTRQNHSLSLERKKVYSW